MQNADNNALKVFMVFIGTGVILLIFSGLTWMNFINNVWLFIWLSILYTPEHLSFIERITDERTREKVELVQSAIDEIRFLEELTQSRA